MRALLLACLCLTGCAGLGKFGDGDLVAVEGRSEIAGGGQSPEEASGRARADAERNALYEMLSVYFSSAARARHEGDLNRTVYARPGTFIRRTKVLREAQRVGAADTAGGILYSARVRSDIRLNRLTGELDRLGLEEAGAEGRPRVVLSVSEPKASPGEPGRASTALRRSLIRRGFSVFDLSDSMVANFDGLGDPKKTRSAAEKMAAGMTLTGEAAVVPAPDARLAGYHRSQASVRVILSTTPASSSAGVEFSAAALAVDLDAEGSRKRALEDAGELLGEKLSGHLILSYDTRHEIQVSVAGLSGFEKVSRFIDRLRHIPEIAAASLRSMSPAGIRLRISGLREADEIAAALMRLKDYSIRTLSVEDDLIDLEVE